MKVALTIDTEQRSRPAAAANPRRQLDLLAAEGVHATFFVQGRWVSACPDVARRIADGGHLLGNHTYHHVPLTLMSDQGIRHTVLRAEEAIVQRTGAGLRPWFRCPYGDGEDDPRVLATLRDVGYTNVGWDVDPNDWRPGRRADEVVEAVLAGCRETSHEAHDEVRVLLHSWPDATAAALPGIVAGLRAAGAELVRLDELAEPAAHGRARETDDVNAVDL